MKHPSKKKSLFEKIVHPMMLKISKVEQIFYKYSYAGYMLMILLCIAFEAALKITILSYLLFFMIWPDK